MNQREARRRAAYELAIHAMERASRLGGPGDDGRMADAFDRLAVELSRRAQTPPPKSIPQHPDQMALAIDVPPEGSHEH